MFKSFAAFLGLAIVLYAILIALLTLLQRQLIYIPPPIDEAQLKQLRAHGFEELSEEKHGHLGWLKQGSETAPQIYVFHGNATDAPRQLSWIFPLLEKDLHIVLAEYPGYGLSSKKSTQRTIEKHASLLMEEVQARIPQSSTTSFFLGDSIGSGASLVLARKAYLQNQPVGGIILIAGFSKLSDVASNHYPFIPFIEKILWERFDNLKALEDINAPLLAIHGTNDNIIPVKMSKQLYKKASHPASELLILEGVGHNDMWQRFEAESEFWSTINAFIRRHR